MNYKIIFLVPLVILGSSCNKLRISGIDFFKDKTKKEGGRTQVECETLSDNRPYAKGDGSSDTPFLICNHEQFNEIGGNTADWSSHFILGDSIDLSSYNLATYNLIGGDDCATNRFTGIFDGADNTISNLSLTKAGNVIGVFGCFNGTLRDVNFENINLVAEEDIGVIAFLGRNDGSTTATIENVSVSDSSFEGSYKVAPLAGSSRESTIDTVVINNVSITNSTGYGSDASLAIGYCEEVTSIANLEISSSSVDHIDYVGGIFGQAGDSCIATVFDISSVTIEGHSEVGGVFGVAGGGYATDGSFSGAVHASTTNAGALFGRSWWCDGVTFENIILNGTVSSDLFSGGAIGHLDDWVTCNIEKVESFANSTSTSGYSGGFVGRIGNTSTISNSASFGTSNGVFSGGFVGKLDDGSIATSYAMGAVSGATRGGFSGEYTSGSCTNCFFIETTNETTTADPDATLVDNDDLANTGVFTGWDFTTVWEMRNNRPRIITQD